MFFGMLLLFTFYLLPGNRSEVEASKYNFETRNSIRAPVYSNREKRSKVLDTDSNRTVAAWDRGLGSKRLASGTRVYCPPRMGLASAEIAGRAGHRCFGCGAGTEGC